MELQDFNFKKKYGQNFLNDITIPKKIVDSAMIDNDSLVIEIGPGAGIMTKLLAEHKNVKQVLAYEIDESLESILDKKLVGTDNVDIIYDDFLKRNVKNDIKKYNYSNLYVIANLPYYITTPIIEKIIEANIDVKECIFMVQKEVADRLASKSGNKDYGYITVYLNYYFNISKLFEVKREYFDPIPNVDSAIIKLERKDNKQIIDINKFNKLIKSAFLMKRKNLRNNLKSYNLVEIEKVLNEYNLTLQNRAEEVPLECFIDITKVI